MGRFLRSVLVFGALVVFTNHLFYQLVETKNPWALRKRQIKETKWTQLMSTETVETVFLGSSRGFLAYSPTVFDSINGGQSYNLCTGSQNIVETYYVLEDLIERKKPDCVFYEIFLPSFSKHPDFLNVITTSEQFRSTYAQWEMMIYGFGVDGLVNKALPLVRDKAYVKVDIMRALFSPEKQQQTDSLTVVKGHNQETKVVSDAAIAEFDPIYDFDNTEVSERKLNYWFPKFVELCRSNDIELVCVRAPYPPSRLNINRKDTVHQHFSSLLIQNRIRFIDLNYPESGTSAFKYVDQHFYDHHHMNYEGAKVATAELAHRLGVK